MATVNNIYMKVGYQINSTEPYAATFNHLITLPDGNVVEQDPLDKLSSKHWQIVENEKKKGPTKSELIQRSDKRRLLHRQAVPAGLCRYRRGVHVDGRTITFFQS